MKFEDTTLFFNKILANNWEYTFSKKKTSKFSIFFEELNKEKFQLYIYVDKKKNTLSAPFRYIYDSKENMLHDVDLFNRELIKNSFDFKIDEVIF